uniref:Uncharacterized protein n=1 Tax=Nelumbo nucifera TaxID=4432 RepID=A0A822Z7R6_NELNU|nr:TPA_asm: hypothetical protein HUJ06_000684 [Nelumbo nucifera]
MSIQEGLVIRSKQLSTLTRRPLLNMSRDLGYY